MDWDSGGFNTIWVFFIDLYYAEKSVGYVFSKVYTMGEDNVVMIVTHNIVDTVSINNEMNTII